MWEIANIHQSDFEKDNKAWGQWWMAIVQDQNPKLRLRRSLHHLRQFVGLTTTTFTDFGHNPTKFSTEWIVIQLVRLGDHLLAAHVKSEYGFNWPYAYQKTAAHLAKNRITQVTEIFTALDALWPAGVRMTFHYSNPSFNDCVLTLAEDDDAVGKIPAMKKMRHAHDEIFGGPNVANRCPDSDTSVNSEPQYVPYTGMDNQSAPSQNSKKRRVAPPTITIDDEDSDEWTVSEPRKPASYSDLFR